jgi:hypothetical protein
MTTKGLAQRIGSDHVVLADDRLVVISRAHMEAWSVRKYRQTLIRFNDREWRVIETRVVPPDATQYTLAPWDLGPHDVVGQTVDYGASYVADRDRLKTETTRVRRASHMLRMVAPFTGFLSARIKDRLEVLYGIDPVATTRQTCFMQGLVAICAMAVMQVGVAPRLCLLLAIVLLLDAAVRWDRVLAEQRPPPGFYEWFRLWR